MNKIDKLMGLASKDECTQYRETEVSDAEIEQLEKAYSISLPDDYRYMT